MKYPKITIKWVDWQKVPTTIELRRLRNGYLIGNTFFASEDLLVKNLAEYVKNPHAYAEAPEYKDAGVE